MITMFLLISLFYQRNNKTLHSICYLYEVAGDEMTSIAAVTLESRHEKILFFAYPKTKTQISCAVTAQLISAFGFAIYTESTIPFLSKPKISSLRPSSVSLQSSLYRARSEPPKAGFLMTQVISWYQIRFTIIGVSHTCTYDC